MLDTDKSLLSSQAGQVFEWRKWCKEIPFIPLKKGWLIQPIPPFGGAVARFVVKKGDKRVSVYLDCYEQLGCWDRPHWEIYPGSSGENERYDMEKVDELVKAIDASFKKGKAK